jgi:signal transduction histidine kinase
MTVPQRYSSSDPVVITAVEEARVAVRDRRRLAAVHATGLLDSEVEEAFDRLTRLAVRLVRIPAAFVSLVDEDRDFYKSACGFGEPLASSRELHGLTFCHFTIQSSDPLVIPDTKLDPVYRHVPTVQSLGVAAYVGVPIVVNGQIIGAFCAIDMVPHAWTEDEITILKELAAVAVSEISLRSAHKVQMQQSQELEKARAIADEANRAKSDFLAAMSHDLRTPLNAIGGYAQLIELGVNGPVTDEQRDSAGRIMRAQRHLLKLIDDILDFAKAERGEISLHIATISMTDVCEPLTSLVTGQAEVKEISFSCEVADPALAASGDYERIIQVLVNLVTNAIKFTDKKGTVAARAQANGEWVEFVVTDTGRGIAPEHFELIFNPFVQLDGTTGTHGGVGLGLATSRDMARRMGGDIVVQSEIGSGSTFTLRLKRA